MVEGVLFVGVGWHVWVSLVVVGLLFKVELILCLDDVVVGVVLVELGLVVGAVVWLLLVLVGKVGTLFISVCIVGVVG